jgi:6,7-dimethyl-8-ribityllumazine synthase
MSTNSPKQIKFDLPSSTRIAIVAARFNGEIVDKLLEGCIGRLREIGLDEGRIESHRVPGAFELPVAAKLFVETKRYDAVILLGCVIRGETYHFETVANEAARGVQQVAIDSGTPCIFGVLTVENMDQALARAGGSHGHAGVSSADAAAEMIALARKVKR